jgi:hypothetical protein
VTSAPPAARSRAAASPASPAPSTRTSVIGSAPVPTAGRQLAAQAPEQHVAGAVAVEQPEIEHRVDPVGGGGEPCTGPGGVERARHRAVLLAVFQQAHHAIEPGPVPPLDQGLELVVEAQARPDLVPEDALVADGRVGVDAEEKRALEPVGPGGKAPDLVVDELVEAALGECKRAAQQLLPGREVVVHERLRDARLLGDARHAQPVGALADDNAAGSL